MRKIQATFLAFTMFAGLGLTGCAVQEQQTEHYVSSSVQGEAQKINLDAVQTAFWDTKGKDFNSWMTAFEKRVNEIYEGTGVVSIDATRKTGKLSITGYIDDKKEAGFQQGEEKLFSIEQTGDVTDNKLPYQVTGSDNKPYYQGHHSILDSPIVQMLVLSHLMSSWGGRYYTPPGRTVILGNQRDTFRNSPNYSGQKTANRSFDSRYKNRLAGGYASRNKFGKTPFSTTTGAQRRPWGGMSNPSGGVRNPSYGWGGRRSPFGMSRGGWGGRRR